MLYLRTTWVDSSGCPLVTLSPLAGSLAVSRRTRYFSPGARPESSALAAAGGSGASACHGAAAGASAARYCSRNAPSAPLEGPSQRARREFDDDRSTRNHLAGNGPGINTYVSEFQSSNQHYLYFYA